MAKRSNSSLFPLIHDYLKVYLPTQHKVSDFSMVTRFLALSSDYNIPADDSHVWINSWAAKKFR